MQVYVVSCTFEKHSNALKSEGKQPYISTPVSILAGPEFPRNDRQRKSCWLHPWESGRVSPRTRWSDYISDLACWPVLVWSQQSYLRLLLTVRYTSPPRAAAPTTLTGKSRCMKMNEGYQQVYLFRYHWRWCCDRKSRAAYAQSLALWQQATIEFTCHDHSIIACSRHIYVWCCSSRTSRSWWITQSTQHHRRGCNTAKAHLIVCH